MHDSADARLAAELAAGRDDAYAALYDRYGPALYRVAWSLLRSRPDAEDAVQEVFMGLVRNRAALGRVENLRAYLFSTLRHAAARLAERRPKPPPVREAATAKAIDAELSDRLERGLAALPAEQREVLSLKIDGGLTFAEIAAVLDVRPNTAASRYRYALEKLRDSMADEQHESRSTTSGSA
jgi:RNA polymerase sigma-70 factor (ECF subfamily)